MQTSVLHRHHYHHFIVLGLFSIGCFTPGQELPDVPQTTRTAGGAAVIVEKPADDGDTPELSRLGSRARHADNWG